MAQRIVFRAKQVVELEEFEPGQLEPGQVRVQAWYSLMSTGTENIAFNRLFEAGSHWDNYVKYPFYPGYALVGEVIETGQGVEGLKRGDRVAVRAAHASEVVVAATSCYSVPAELDPRAAVWFALAKIAFMGARAAQYQLGGSVLIIGAGPIGQMSLRWASAAGLHSVIVADALPERLELARSGGATEVLPQPIQEAVTKVQQLTDGHGPQVVIDATGSASVFVSALEIVRSRGRVVILGDTGSPTSQHLTSAVITRGLTIVGAHDILNDAEWNDATITKLFFRLVQTRRFRLDGLNSHEFAPHDCEKAYQLANARRAETMGLVFNWKEV